MRQLENPFESGQRKAIPAVLIYLERDEKILMIHRNKPDSERRDFHAGKWNGLGGKCELDESPLDSAVRELREESGFDLPPSQFQALGVIQFPNFKPAKNEDWIVFVFSVFVNSTQVSHPSFHCEEGSLHWIPKRDLSKLNLWPGDRYFIPFVLENRPFMGTIWYEGNDVNQYWMQSLDGSDHRSGLEEF